MTSPWTSLVASSAGSEDIECRSTENDISDLHSPSQQLEEMSQAAAMLSRRVSQDPPHQSEPNPERTVLLSFDGTADDVSTAAAPTIYPNHDVPASSMGSVRSGRQPDPDFSVDLGHDPFDQPDQPQDTADESHQGNGVPFHTTQERTPTKLRAKATEESSSTMSSISLPLFLRSGTPQLRHATLRVQPRQDPLSDRPSQGANHSPKRVGNTTRRCGFPMRLVRDSDSEAAIPIKTSGTQESSNVDGIRTFDKSVSPPALPNTRRRVAKLG